MRQLLINISGHNATGKTTVARKLEKIFGFNRISGDDFRNFLDTHIAYLRDFERSYPNPRADVTKTVVYGYRLELARALLKAGQNVLNDGSGANREAREKFIGTLKQEFPEIYTVIIWVNLDESELLKRLAKRDESGSKWTQMYHDYRKELLKPPEPDEADEILYYNQHNYAEIEQRLRELLT